MKKKDLEYMSDRNLIAHEEHLISKLQGIDRCRDRVISKLDHIAVIKLARENNREQKVKINCK